MVSMRILPRVVFFLFLAFLIAAIPACSGGGGGGGGGGGAPGGGAEPAEPTDGNSVTQPPDPDAPRFAGLNFIALHDNDSPQYNDRCVDCHGSMKYETSLNPGIPGAHQAMLPETPGETNNERCLHCHPSVDLLEKSEQALMRQVDPNICALCHSSQGPGRQFYAN
ncbi:MAG: hypothetical protein HY801_10055 [Candidatus Lindowbacteria bacterium]|nr:hypothetical protein [Candidatus Lindowbacteria bacterium]